MLSLNSHICAPDKLSLSFKDKDTVVSGFTCPVSVGSTHLQYLRQNQQLLTCVESTEYNLVNSPSLHQDLYHFIIANVRIKN